MERLGNGWPLGDSSGVVGAGGEGALLRHVFHALVQHLSRSYSMFVHWKSCFGSSMSSITICDMTPVVKIA